MSNLPVDVANQALDAIGYDSPLGELTEGTPAANVVLRHYGQSIRQILRSTPWRFARKQAPLTMLADATGILQANDQIGAYAAVDRAVPGPFRFAYAYPDDCMKMMAVGVQPQQLGPAAGVIGVPTPWLRDLRLVRYEVSTDFNHPPAAGLLTPDVQGISNQGRTIVMTDYAPAQAIYTSLSLAPSTWDPMFRAAVVAHLASHIAMAVIKDKKMAMALRRDQIAMARQAIVDARVANGNEGSPSSDIRVDWMDARIVGGCYGRHIPDGDPRDVPATYDVWGTGEPVGFSDGSSI